MWFSWAAWNEWAEAIPVLNETEIGGKTKHQLVE